MPGIDALTIGPTDLAQDLGVYGTPDMEKVLDERRWMIVEAARKHGKTTAMLAFNEQQTRQWKEAGARLLAYSSEVGVLQGAYRRALAEIKG
jgi:2-keto-3-deoxy-L-rhamnonate aldolase RhmA